MVDEHFAVEWVDAFANALQPEMALGDARALLRVKSAAVVGNGEGEPGLLRNAGTLYGFPEYAARGIRREERLRADNGPALEFRDGSKVPSAVQDYYRLVEEERCELMHTIRPGEENGGCFWNVNAKLFIYPPSFDFKKAGGPGGCHRIPFLI